MTAPVRVGPSPSGGGSAAFPDLEELVADIGDRIRAERQHRGWTQAELGTRAGVSGKCVGLTERGIGILPIVRLAELCAGLGVSLGYLLSDDWQMSGRKVKPQLLTPRQAQVLAESRSGLPLSGIGKRVGIPTQAVGARLSEAYRLLGVSHLPHGRRREAAIRAAVERGLLPPTLIDDAA